MTEQTSNLIKDLHHCIGHLHDYTICVNSDDEVYLTSDSNCFI